MDFRLEHPRPELVRENWLSLNGVWDFEIDNARVGIWKGYEKRASLDDKINVPFCPESRLSGIAHTDFMYGVWYKRKVTLEKITGRVVLHFGETLIPFDGSGDFGAGLQRSFQIMVNVVSV